MLKKRLIPVIILRNGNVVQSVGFKHTNIIHENPRFAVEFFSKWDADEIILLDVSRDEEKRDVFLKSVEEISKTCFVPLSVGGWINSLKDMAQMLSIGADKVVINTEAYRNPDLISQGAKRYGSQCIVVGIDCLRSEERGHSVFIDRGRENTGVSPVDWAKKAEEQGAGEIFLSSIDNDGNRGGYDLDLMRSVVEAVSIPVIAFGGASNPDQLAQGALAANVEAMAAANMFHYTENSLRKAKRGLKELGVSIRI